MSSPVGVRSIALGLGVSQGSPVGSNPLAIYQRAHVMGASPMGLILILYDLAIASCGRSDGERASRAITELIAGLNFDYDEIAVGLFRLYEYCLGAIRAGSCDEASKILRELKGAWETALRGARPEGAAHGTL
jgi:flagellin-specific chaperone FliS